MTNIFTPLQNCPFLYPSACHFLPLQFLVAYAGKGFPFSILRAAFLVTTISVGYAQFTPIQQFAAESERKED
jgi:hypothetical protein